MSNRKVSAGVIACSDVEGGKLDDALEIGRLDADIPEATALDTKELEDALLAEDTLEISGLDAALLDVNMLETDALEAGLLEDVPNEDDRPKAELLEIGADETAWLVLDRDVLLDASKLELALLELGVPVSAAVLLLPPPACGEN